MSLVAYVPNRTHKQFRSEKLRLDTMYNLSNKDKLSIGAYQLTHVKRERIRLVPFVASVTNRMHK